MKSIREIIQEFLQTERTEEEIYNEFTKKMFPKEFSEWLIKNLFHRRIKPFVRHEILADVIVDGILQ